MRELHLFDTTLRDGIQTLPFIPTAKKLEILKILSSTGLKDLEITSFVNPKVIPQMQDTEVLFKSALLEKDEINLHALVPNLKGLEKAIATGVKHISYIASISDEFSRKNVGRGREEVLNDLVTVVELTTKNKIALRLDIPMAFGFKHAGEFCGDELQTFLKKLSQIGITKTALSDTLGLATPAVIKEVIDDAKNVFSLGQIAFHLHNQEGNAVTNAILAFELGISSFDGTLGGVGGCPFTNKIGCNLDLEIFLRELSCKHEFKCVTDQQKLQIACQTFKKVLI